MLSKMLWLSLAGAIGTVSRYALVEFVHKYFRASFPFGTLTVNLLGCFLAGLLWALFENKILVSSEIKFLVLVGFMGAFTTFSAFILETGELVRSAAWVSTAMNIASQNGLGIIALFLGMNLGKSI